MAFGSAAQKQVKGQPITGANAQNRPKNPSSGKTVTGRQAEKQIPQPQEPFRNPMAALSPVPSKNVNANYSKTKHQAGLAKSKSPKHPNPGPVGGKRSSTIGKQAGKPSFYGH